MFYIGRTDSWYIKYSVTSSVKHTQASVHKVSRAQKRTVEACDISIRSVERIISEGNVTICIFLSASHSPLFKSVTLVMD
jgi:hypothetical protein